MKATRSSRWPLLLALLFAAGSAWGQSARAGSANWFHRMRDTAANQELLRTLGATSSETIPPGYVEVAGIIRILPQSAFADGHLPNLHVLCDQPCTDPVVRKPRVTMKGKRLGEFYTVLKRGQKYKFDLTVFFIHNIVGTWTVPDNAPGQMRLRLTLGRPGSTSIAALQNLRSGMHSNGQDDSRQAIDTGLDALDDALDDALNDALNAVPPPDPVHPIALQRALARSRALGYSTSKIPPLPQDLQTIADAMRSLPEQEPAATQDATRPVLAMRNAASVGPDQFDLSGLSTPPNGARQAALWKQILSATTPEQKAKAHQALTDYYRSQGRHDRSAREAQRARYWASQIAGAHGSQP